MAGYFSGAPDCGKQLSADDCRGVSDSRNLKGSPPRLRTVISHTIAMRKPLALSIGIIHPVYLTCQAYYAVFFSNGQKREVSIVHHAR